MKERVLEGINPERVFYYFEEISKIPRPSYNEKAISDYLVEFAKSHGFDYWQDESFNVIIVREASVGYENEEPIILQGHMDMVCEKTASCETDPEKDGVFIETDGQWISARETTLGGDDGIAVAYALAILEDEALKTPRLEFVCTVSEETGMEGANAIDLSVLKGRRIINIDSENEGELLAGCAGGGRFNAELPVESVDCDGDDIEVSISGLAGGHSGTEIHKGRGNAIRLMVRLMRRLSQESEINIVDFNGGDKDNAIPRSACALLRVNSSDKARFFEIAQKEISNIKKEYELVDPDLDISLNEKSSSGKAINTEDTRKIIRLLLSLPNGVIRMSDHIDNLVETSLNLGKVRFNDNKVTITYSLRSSVTAAYEALRENMRFMAEGYQASVSIHGEYPAWEYRMDSPLRDLVCKVYHDQTGKDMRIGTIHAGLECGIFAGKNSEFDIVSLGPDILDIHTPDERANIASVARVYELVREVISHKGMDDVQA